MKIGVEREIGARPEDVWNLTVDTEGWKDWKPSVTGVESADRYIRRGTTGEIETQIGLDLSFEVTGYKHGRYWSWDIAQVGATGHRIEPIAGGTRVTLELPVYAAAYAPVCRRSLGMIEELAAPS